MNGRGVQLRYFVLIAVIVLGLSFSAIATPPERPSLPEIVTAYLVFPADREPDFEGNFEIEVYCKAHFPIDDVKVRIGYSDEIIFKPMKDIIFDEQAFQLLEGKMKQGEVRIWRLKGRLTKNPILEGEVIPASVALYINYIFPTQVVIRNFEQNSTLSLADKERMLVNIRQEENGKNRTIVRALPVLRKSQ